MVKNLPANAGDTDSIPSGLGRFPWQRKWQPTPVFLPGKSHGQKSLAGHSLWGPKRVGLSNNNNSLLDPKRTVVLEKTLESPLDCKEIQPVHSEGDQSWDFFGGNDSEAVLWPPQAKS